MLGTRLAFMATAPALDDIDLSDLDWWTRPLDDELTRDPHCLTVELLENGPRQVDTALGLG